MKFDFSQYIRLFIVINVQFLYHTIIYMYQFPFSSLSKVQILLIGQRSIDLRLMSLNYLLLVILRNLHLIDRNFATKVRSFNLIGQSMFAASFIFN